MQKRGRGKEVQPPEDPKPPRTTHKLLQVCLFFFFDKCFRYAFSPIFSYIYILEGLILAIYLNLNYRVICSMHLKLKIFAISTLIHD